MADTKARALRKNPTDAERKLWAYLRLRQVRGHKFRRQRPIGPYIVDFVCLEERLVIEVDGSQHMEQASHDARRDRYLMSLGFTVLRFWDNQVLSETDAVMGVIAQALEMQGDPPS
ncbi:MAG: endonuclease domain-containing protein [Chloroflexota bacterium]|nr:endonuclease domain-containing protein [Chloroflexota bacterium]